MLDVDRVLRQDRWMRAMTGLNLQAFARLLVSFSMAYEAAEQQETVRSEYSNRGFFATFNHCKLSPSYFN